MTIEYKLEEIKETGKKIVEFLNENKNYKTVAFDGKMGSGKTTLIKEICRNLDVIDEVTSPTFAIINEYESKQEHFIYHFDFYRLKNIQEALDIGTEDYFYSEFYCFLEWPQIVLSILPTNTLFINIEIIDDFKRKLEISKTQK